MDVLRARAEGRAAFKLVGQVNSELPFMPGAALGGARSILTVEATRQAGAKTRSNIRWRYGHENIPRHLRDIIVTEYGVADLRGKSDAEVISAMLHVADSRNCSLSENLGVVPANAGTHNHRRF